MWTGFSEILASWASRLLSGSGDQVPPVIRVYVLSVRIGQRSTESGQESFGKILYSKKTDGLMNAVVLLSARYGAG